ncbi:hypothetical protein [Nocardia brasiliensis]|uniref:Secreted protein n=1 Tax=Nocardia brasiliensis (strain ATCC 700358 / HUJEG-1) TaxID=1133849 RepID=K0F611_NOCB7|nr:hypothetical protein [Nocardia brasiliensis]AFU05069.1 hypothetical protein O3I_035610 [Nocardia brasiliensis ATCC 700358]
MLARARLLLPTAVAVGFGLVLPGSAPALADPPAAPTLCTEQQERDADAAADTAAIDECSRLRIQSAKLRQANVPVPEDPEKITPFVLKTDIGVSPETRKEMFGDSTVTENGGGRRDYVRATARAAYYTGFYTARQGGALYADPAKVPTTTDVPQDDQLASFLTKKLGGGDGKTHDDQNLTPELLTAKHTALAAAAAARFLAGDGTAGQGPAPDATDPDSDDMEADARPDAAALAELARTGPAGDSVRNRIAANKAEAAAVDAARVLGWLA